MLTSPAEAYRVGRALAYLVVRSEGYAGEHFGELSFYDDQRATVRVVPGVEVLKAYAENYPSQRGLYSDDRQALLDNGIDLVPTTQALAGFIDGLQAMEAPGYQYTEPPPKPAKPNPNLWLVDFGTA